MAFIMHVGCLVSFSALSSLVTGQSVSSEDGSGSGLDSLYSSFSTNSTVLKSVSISSEVLADSPSGTPGGTFTVMTTSTEELLVPIPSSLLGKWLIRVCCFQQLIVVLIICRHTI